MYIYLISSSRCFEGIEWVSSYCVFCSVYFRNCELYFSYRFLNYHWCSRRQVLTVSELSLSESCRSVDTCSLDWSRARDALIIVALSLALCGNIFLVRFLIASFRKSKFFDIQSRLLISYFRFFSESSKMDFVLEHRPHHFQDDMRRRYLSNIYEVHAVTPIFTVIP